MERYCNRIIILLVLMILSSSALRAQSQDSTHTKRLWIGLELPSMFALPFMKGYAFQPMVLLNLSKYATVWAGGGAMKVSRDTLFNNMYNYNSQGRYLKAGADINLNIKEHNATGFRLGAGINVASFTEEGQLRFGYPPGLFGDEMPENVYIQTLENKTWAASLEFRQAFFAESGRLALQLQTQLNYVMKHPNNPRHPVHYIPGMGTYMPQPFLGDRKSPRRIVPGACLYLFYSLF